MRKDTRLENILVRKYGAFVKCDNCGIVWPLDILEDGGYLNGDHVSGSWMCPNGHLVYCSLSCEWEGVSNNELP
jgi:hypothetical protein